MKILLISEDKIPLVRSTTKYNKPIQKFQKIHHEIIDKIKKVTGYSEFNNALKDSNGSQFVNYFFNIDKF